MKTNLRAIATHFLVAILFISSLYFGNVAAERLLHFGFWLLYGVTLLSVISSELRDAKSALNEILRHQLKYPRTYKILGIFDWLWLILIVITGWYILGIVGWLAKIFIKDYANKLRKQDEHSQG